MSKATDGEIGDLRDQRSNLIAKGIDPNFDGFSLRAIADRQGIARIIDPVNFNLDADCYGTDDEGFKNTFAYGAQLVALEKADKIIKALGPSGFWLPISKADKTIVHEQHFPTVNMTLRNSERYWVRDADGRVYEASWSEGNNGRDFWWDWEGESPVDPVEFMPHPLSQPT